MAGPSPRVNSRSWKARAVPSKALATLWDWAGAISEMAAPLTGSSVDASPAQRRQRRWFVIAPAPDRTAQKRLGSSASPGAPSETVPRPGSVSVDVVTSRSVREHPSPWRVRRVRDRRSE